MEMFSHSRLGKHTPGSDEGFQERYLERHFLERYVLGVANNTGDSSTSNTAHNTGTSNTSNTVHNTGALTKVEGPLFKVKDIVSIHETVL